jgi:hypothetical protein
MLQKSVLSIANVLLYKYILGSRIHMGKCEDWPASLMLISELRVCFVIVDVLLRVYVMKSPARLRKHGVLIWNSKLDH